MKSEAISLLCQLSSYVANDIISLKQTSIDIILKNIYDLTSLVSSIYDENHISSENAVPLTFKEYAISELTDKNKQDMFDKLYGYDRNEISKTETDSIMFKKPENIIDKYNNMPIKPVIKSVDLNNQYKKEFDEYNKPKTAYVIGLEMKF